MNAPANTKTAVPVAPSLKDLLYLYRANYGQLLHQMKITDRAIEDGAVTNTHWQAQNIIAQPCEETLVAICAYRPTTVEETSAKAAFLEDFIIAGQLPDDALTALVRSLLPAPVPTVATLFAEWWRLDRTEPADEAEDDANNARMYDIEKRMLALPTVTASDLAMKIIVNTYHGGSTTGADVTRSLYPLAGVSIPDSIEDAINADCAAEAA
jgi:hypothetical protein